MLLNQGEQKKHDYLYWEFYEQSGKRAILKGDWKLILYNTNTELNPKFELFDLSNDLSEKKNVAAKHPKVASELTSLMNQSRTPSADSFFRFASERK